MKKSFQKVFTIRLIIALLVLNLGVTGYLLYRSQLTPKYNNNDYVRIKLINADSEKLIRNTKVYINSDNGIRCVTAPCPNESKKWLGKTDLKGIVYVPNNVVDSVTSVSAEGYRDGRDLYDDSEKIDDIYILELDPTNKIDNSERRLKIIDSATTGTITDVNVWITNNPDCRPKQCSDYSFTSKTNGLGNIYYPLDSVKFESWVYVEGYKVTKKPNGYKEYKVLLEKE